MGEVILESLAAFLMISLVSVLSPGPAVLLATNNSIHYGFSRSLYSTVGNVLGLMSLSISSLMGLAALLTLSERVFIVVKLLGCAYLLYLGIQKIRNSGTFTPSGFNSAAPKGNKRLFLEGYFIAITNPKALLFYTALLPVFIDASQPLMGQALMLTSINMLCSFVALAGYGLLASALAKHWFTQTRLKYLDRITGGLFISFAAALFWVSRPRAC